MNPTFISRTSLYSGDYDCLFRTPENEMPTALHYHDFYEIVLYLGNAGIFLIDGKEHLITRGDIALINMFTPHTLIHNKNVYYERFSISIDPSLLLSFNTPTSNLMNIFSHHNKNYPIFHVEGKCLNKYLRILQEYTHDQPAHGKDMFEKALLHQIAAYLFSDCFDGIHYNDKESRHIELVATLVEYINQHLAEDLSLSTLAEYVNYSEYYVGRIFKSVTNYTLTNYIIEKRISKAMSYLQTDMSITEAAEKSGFNNYSYFYKTFRKYTGMNPADYKQQLS